MKGKQLTLIIAAIAMQMQCERIKGALALNCVGHEGVV